MAGAFQISRDIFNNPIWSDVPKFRIFFFIVGNAVFAEDGVQIAHIHIKRGQFLRSYRNLSDDLQYIENRTVKKYSISVISRKIDSLVKEERLKIEDTELGTLFTVVNYDEYQRLENYKRKLGTELEQSWNSDGTELEQSRNNNKKVNNVKEDIYTIFNHWNSKKIIVHKKMNDKMKSHINARLEDYSLDELLKAIDNFSNVLNNDMYYWSHKWTLQDFMLPNNAIRFMDQSDPFKTFLSKSYKPQQQEPTGRYIPDFDEIDLTAGED